jgi:ABC-type polysaccharide/polyol phosphate transport system ATPase subunit
MHRTLPAAEAASLPEDLIVSVEGISRALPPPYKAVPRWIARVLPKSGLAGRTGPEMQDLVLDDDDQDDDDDDDYLGEEPAALHELSFELRRGQGIGIVGNDSKGIATIVRILIGGLPPSTGRVLFRGLVAPVTMGELRRLMGTELDRKAVNVMARYFHWPRRVIDARWDEIEEFAAVDEVANRARYRTLRLAVSATLHMDATLYVLDNSIQDDGPFAARCLDLVAQRKAEGAAVIQAGRRFIEGVARLSDQVLWLENGEVVYRGRPVEVAAELHRNTVEKVGSHAVPVTATLLDGADPVRLGPGSSHVDFEVHVLRKELELGFGLELTDEHGQAAELRKPERLHAPEPGVYRLRVSVPDGLLDERSYRVRLTVEIAISGHEPAAPRELVAFDAAVASGGRNGDEEDLPVGFVFLPVADVEMDESDDATWDVSRIGS